MRKDVMKESDLEKKWAEAESKAPKEAEAEDDLKPQVVYGIHLMWMSNNQPHVEITGTPTTPEIFRLVQEANNNLQASVIADRVVEVMKTRR